MCISPRKALLWVGSYHWKAITTRISYIKQIVEQLTSNDSFDDRPLQAVSLLFPQRGMRMGKVTRPLYLDATKSDYRQRVSNLLFVAKIA